MIRKKKETKGKKDAAPDEAPDVQAAADPAAELQALNDRLLRLQADFDNFRKRTNRERDSLYSRANEDLLLDLLPALDHMELALEHAETDGTPPALAEGFRLVREQLLTTLRKFGLSVVDAEGSEFDPNLHEAISHIQSDDVPANRILQQTRRGYLLGDKVLRAAEVVVSSGPAGGAETGAPAATSDVEPGDGQDEDDAG